MDASDLLALRDPVLAVLRRAAETAILPRFRQLRHSDVVEKSPGEWVTVADRESEQILAGGLTKILADARVIGEEACSADPSLLEGLDQGLVWIVDPLDGTANFASGREPFGIIVALASAGESLAAWLHDPVSERLCFAARGCGAQLSTGNAAARELRAPAEAEAPVATLATQFMTDELRAHVTARAEAAFVIRPIPRCAAEHYPRLCTGENHLAVFQRTLPWDHAAGALLLEEAGGRVARWDGSPYRFHDDGMGILAASSPRLWDRAAQIIFHDGLHADSGHLRAADVKLPHLLR